MTRTSGKTGPSAHHAYSRAMLQAAIGSVMIFSIADQNPIYFILSVFGIAVAWLFSVRPGRPAPRIMINTILFLVVGIAGVEMLRIGVGVSAFAVFVALLMVVKMLDLREPRDDGQIIVLSVSILIAAVLTSNTLMTGVLMVVVSVLIMRAVVLYQIHAVLFKSASDSEIIGKKARIDIRSMIFATGFLCAIFGTVIFVVLPRNIGMQAFGQWGSAGQSVSGFSDVVELGRPGFISQSSTPVLDLTISDRNGQNAGSQNTPAIYLRGAVLNEYNDGRWIRGSLMGSPLSNRSRLISPNTSLKSYRSIDNSDWDRQFDITVRSASNGPTYLFAPWQTVEFRVGDEPIRLGLDFNRGIFIKDGIGGKIEYVVRSKNTEFDQINYALVEDRNPVTSTVIEPQIEQLAHTILSSAGLEPDPDLRPIQDDAAAVRVIEKHLRSQYTYTLDSQPVPPGEDATKWFLFERKTGHCEYFASSLALMSRSIGIPARVLTGYIASDFNEVTGQFVVRESNAHAWVEAEIAQGEWRTFDGTPPADFHSIHEPDPSIWRSISKMYESVEFLWVRSVVGYDSTSRQSIIGSSSTDFGLSSMGESLLNRFAAGRSRLITRAIIIAVIVFAISMFVGIIVLKYKEIITNVLEWIRSWFVQIRKRFLGENGLDTDPRFNNLESLVRRSLDRLDISKPEWKPLKSHIREELLPLDAVALPTLEALVEASELLYLHKFSQVQAPSDASQIARLESQLRKSEKLAAEKR